ncbi:MAG: helix-turn-helix domain-containing protein [Gammaproteobacteria bacterium]
MSTTLATYAAKDLWARAAVGMPPGKSWRDMKPWHASRGEPGRIDACDVGGVRLARMLSGALRVVQPLGSAPAVGSPGCYKLMLQISGESILRQAGREVVLSEGMWTLYRAGLPFDLTNLSPCEHRMVVLRRSELLGIPNVDGLTVREFGNDDHSSEQLAGILDSAFDIALKFGEAAAADLAAAAVHLSRVALMENSGEPGSQSSPEIMRSRVLSYIERHLRDPDMSVASIASALNCSTRYLHKSFVGEEATIAESILNRRIERCCEELSRSQPNCGTIAEVAYAWGFKSLSHFSKVFAKRYGMSPGHRRQLSMCGNG